VVETHGELQRVYLLREERHAWSYVDDQGAASERVPLIEEHVHPGTRAALDLAERAEKIARRAAEEWARCRGVQETGDRVMVAVGEPDERSGG
jgi:hypothetical protein